MMSRLAAIVVNRRGLHIKECRLSLKQTAGCPTGRYPFGRGPQPVRSTNKDCISSVSCQEGHVAFGGTAKLGLM